MIKNCLMNKNEKVVLKKIVYQIKHLIKLFIFSKADYAELAHYGKSKQLYFTNE